MSSKPFKSFERELDRHIILINEKDLLRVFHKIEALCNDSIPQKVKISTRGHPPEYSDALMLFIWVCKKFFGVRRDTELFSRLKDSIFYGKTKSKY